MGDGVGERVDERVEVRRRRRRGPRRRAPARSASRRSAPPNALDDRRPARRRPRSTRRPARACASAWASRCRSASTPPLPDWRAAASARTRSSWASTWAYSRRLGAVVGGPQRLVELVELGLQGGRLLRLAEGRLELLGDLLQRGAGLAQLGRLVVASRARRPRRGRPPGPASGRGAPRARRRGRPRATRPASRRRRSGPARSRPHRSTSVTAPARAVDVAQGGLLAPAGERARGCSRPAPGARPRRGRSARSCGGGTPPAARRRESSGPARLRAPDSPPRPGTSARGLSTCRPGMGPMAHAGC